jgi:hypothetical protein
MQLEFGKHAIDSGESSMAALNKLPGPRIGRANWSIWTWMCLMLCKLLQLGGIVGGIALILHIAFEQLSVLVLTWLVAITASTLVFKGYYIFLEKFSIVMIGLFSLFTFICLYFVQYTPYAISSADILDGLRFRLPESAVGFAIAAFGITGVGGDEVLYYPYWCIEKGYAAHAGKRQDNPEWVRRAKGWIKVMYVDALVAMVIYTLVTMAFYLLGAAVLHAQNNIPGGYQMIEILSKMYTESLGPGARAVFLLGAFIVLFSTIIAALAGWTRVSSDAIAQTGLFDFKNPVERKRAIALLAWIFPIIWSCLFLFIKLPVIMVLIGGVGTSLILLIVVFAAFHFRYRRLSPELRPGKIYDAAFWLSATVIVLLGIYGLTKLL